MLEFFCFVKGCTMPCIRHYSFTKMTRKTNYERSSRICGDHKTLWTGWPHSSPNGCELLNGTTMLSIDAHCAGKYRAPRVRALPSRTAEVVEVTRHCVAMNRVVDQHRHIASEAQPGFQFRVGKNISIRPIQQN